MMLEQQQQRRRGGQRSTMIGLRAVAAAICVAALAACAPQWRVAPVDSSADFTSAIRDAAVSADAREALLAAAKRSLRWLNDPASESAYPVRGIRHADALRSVSRLVEILDSQRDAESISETIARDFALYEFPFDAEEASVPAASPVLFTGYYAPQFEGALVRDATYRYPLYAVPDDARRFASRREIEMENLLAGHEIIWLRDPVDAYIAHVNGSVRVRLPDGGHINLGHAATNERPYTSIGRLLIDDGAIEESAMSMQAIRAYFQQRPEHFEDYAHQNQRFVFFETLPDDAWPRGSTGVALLPRGSFASDKAVYPPGCAAVVRTTVGGQPFAQIMFDHDSGGAIVGPRRIDLFMGIGDRAGESAGRLISRGRIQYLLLRK